jgi:hypothetical protein
MNPAEQDSSDRRTEDSNPSINDVRRYEAPRVEKRERLANVTAGHPLSGAPT